MKWGAVEAWIAVFTLINISLLYVQFQTQQTWTQPSERLQGVFRQAAHSVNHTLVPLDEEMKSTLFKLLEKGFVRLGSVGKPYGVSFYHTIHCVNQMASHWLTHSRPTHQTSNNGTDEHTLDRTELVEKHWAHDSHCFEYLARSALCRADPRLLPAPAEQHQSVAMSAELQLHQCRDWNQIRDAVKDNWKLWDDRPYKGTEAD